MLCRLVAAVVDPASGNDGDVTVLANVEVVVDKLFQPGLGKQNRNVNALVFGAGFDDDVNTRFVLFFIDSDML